MMIELRNWLRSHLLYENIDYTLEGKTYDRSGLIQLRCSINNTFHREFRQYIDDFSLNLDKHRMSVETALRQIMCEEDHVLYIDSKTEIINMLQKLDSLSWLSNEPAVMPQIDTLDQSAMYETNEKSVHQSFTVALQLDYTEPSEEDLLVFNDYARILVLNTSKAVGDRLGVYPYSLKSAENTCTVIFRFMPAAISSDKIYAEFTKILNDFTQSGLASRLYTDIDSLEESEIPNFDRILDETGISTEFVEWKESFTKERINTIQKSISVSTRS